MTTGQMPLRPERRTLRAVQLQLRDVAGRELGDWIGARHYIEGLPPAWRYGLEFRERGERIGGMLLGLPPREMDQVRWLCLARLFFVDGTPPFVESQGLAIMRRFVRVNAQLVRGLIAYSDPSQGHEGTIYEADGWAPLGLTKKDRTGHRSRPGRTGEAQPARKHRWVRTP